MSWGAGFTPPPQNGLGTQVRVAFKGKNLEKIMKTKQKRLKANTRSNHFVQAWVGMPQCMSRVCLLDRPHKPHKPTTDAYPLTLVLSSIL